MTNRQTAILVTVAVVAGSIVAGCRPRHAGLDEVARSLQIDEDNGRIGSVVLGETRENVIGALGKPRPAVGSGADTLSYTHLEVGLVHGRVVSIQTDDPAARTLKIVRIGDPLSAARALYRKAAHCVPNSPDKTAPHPHCRITVPAGQLVVVGDPIRTMTLVRG